MKYRILLIACIVTFPMLPRPALGQQPPVIPSGQVRLKPTFDQLRNEHVKKSQGFKNIQLTDAQIGQIRALEEEFGRNMHVITQNQGTQGRGIDDQTRASLKSQQHKLRADIKNILTPQQRKVFDQNLQDRQAVIDQRRAEHQAKLARSQSVPH